MAATRARAPHRHSSDGLSTWFENHPRLRLLLLLGLPLGALVLVYFGSLLILFINAFWQRDPFTGLVILEFTLENFQALAEPLFRTVTLRTLAMASAVTITCAIVAFPIAYYMARVASLPDGVARSS